MKKKIIADVLLCFIIIQSNVCGAMPCCFPECSSKIEQWELRAWFKNDKIVKYKVKSHGKSKSSNRQIVYIIHVSCIDSCHFDIMDDICGSIDTYKNMKFTIVSFENNDTSKHVNPIKKGMEVFLTISPWFGVWFLNDHEDWIINDIKIPYKKIPDQPMVAKEINGLYYSY